MQGKIDTGPTSPGGIIQGERQHEYTNETSGGLFGLVLKKR